MEPGPSSEPEASLVFTGSEDQDVVLAKSFWNSATLQPPLESRLTRRRESSLDGSGSRRSSAGKESPLIQPSFDRIKEEQILEQTQSERKSAKEQYLQKAKRREEIINLFRKQREERIQKESFSNLQKSNTKVQESKFQMPAPDLEEKESVKALN